MRAKPLEKSHRLSNLKVDAHLVQILLDKRNVRDSETSLGDGAKGSLSEVEVKSIEIPSFDLVVAANLAEVLWWTGLGVLERQREVEIIWKIDIECLGLGQKHQD